MKKPCHDNRMQGLLHAYELGMISDKDKDLFETHMLECDFCFQQVKEFMPRGAMLANSTKIKQQLEAGFSSRERKPSLGQRIWQVLWPEGVPAILRPAVLVCVLLLMIYPAYLGIIGGPEDQIATVQEIGLLQTRSNQKFIIDPAQDVILSFICPQGREGQTYSIALENPQGTTIFAVGEFSNVDNYRVGRLLVPIRLISPGKHELSVHANGAAQDELVALEYVFDIEFQRVKR